MRILTTHILAVFVLAAPALAANPDAGKAVALAKYEVDPASPLDTRIDKAPESIIKMLTEGGEPVPQDHTVTDEERAAFNAALEKLTPLHRRFLQERIRTIAFLDGMPNNALTSAVNPDEPYQLFDITIRAGALNETISELVTSKEQTVFDAGDSGLNVYIVAGDMDAIVYVLLHEATHVVDHTLRITGAYDQPPSTAFVSGVWADRATLADAYRNPLLDGIKWRQGGKVLPIADSEMLYRSLEKTPFASLYASANWFDDLAELVTWHHLTDSLAQPYRIELRDGDRTIFAYEPMKSDLVQARLNQIEMFDQPG